MKTCFAVVAVAVLSLVCYFSLSKRSHVELGTEAYLASLTPSKKEDRAGTIVSQLQAAQNLPQSKKEVIVPTAEEVAALQFRTGLERSGISFTEEQMGQVIDSFKEHHAAKAAFETSISEVLLNGEKVVVTIPAYPEAGERLKQLVKADLNKILGENAAQEAWSRAEEAYDQAFDQFGNADQAVELSKTVDLTGALTVKARRSSVWTDNAGAPHTQRRTESFTLNELPQTDYSYLADFLQKVPQPKS